MLAIYSGALETLITPAFPLLAQNTKCRFSCEAWRIGAGYSVAKFTKRLELFNFEPAPT